MLFDSHAHLNDARFDEDREALIQKLQEEHVDLVLNPGADIETSISSVELANKYDFIYAAVGVHPHDVKDLDDTAIDTLRKLATENEKVVAIGEIGLDYYYDNSPREVQKEWFKKQIELANELKLPIIIHDRDAHQDTFEIIKNTKSPEIGCVLHCYSGNVELAKEYVKMGCYISIPGTVTFKNTRNTGTGKVIKTWVDTNGNAIAASNNVERNKQIYFRIKNADGKYITVNGTKYSGSYTFTGTSTKATSLYVNPSTGTFTVSDLPTGKYTVYEYGSPEGYSVNKAYQTITISRDKTSSVSFINSEDSGTAQIKKVWLSDTTLSASEKANLEKNVYFTVKDSDGKYIKVTGSAGAYAYAGTQTTANNLKLSGSKFNVSKLPMGTYTVTEINNASGYNPKTQTKTVTIANKGETKSVSFTNKSTPVVVIRKHFSDEDNLTEAQLKEQYAKVTVNLQVLGYSGSVSSNPPAGYYVNFTGSNGNYTFKDVTATKSSASDLKLNENGEMTISFGTNTAPYYLAVIETYSGTDYDVDNRDQRIDLGDGDPNAVIDLDDIELDNGFFTSLRSEPVCFF